jgi:hypothetical protein
VMRMTNHNFCDLCSPIRMYWLRGRIALAPSRFALDGTAPSANTLHAHEDAAILAASAVSSSAQASSRCAAGSSASIQAVRPALNACSCNFLHRASGESQRRSGSIRNQLRTVGRVRAERGKKSAQLTGSQTRK